MEDYATPNPKDNLEDFILPMNQLINKQRINEKKITWVYPNIIYPKDDSLKNKERNIQDLINESDKMKYNLQIIELKNQSNGIINGFIFTFFLYFIKFFSFIVYL